MEFFNTLSIEHNKKTKKFQWRKSYSLPDFKALLSQVFNTHNEILGLKDRSGNIYDLDYFCKNPQDLKPQVYYLLLDSGMSSVNVSGKKMKTLGNQSNQSSSNISDFFSLKSDFLFFLDKLVDENVLVEEDYYFIKCMFFEQTNYVLTFTRSALLEKNTYKFHLCIQELLSNTKQAKTSSFPFRSPQSFRIENSTPLHNISSPKYLFENQGSLFKSEPNYFSTNNQTDRLKTPKIPVRKEKYLKICEEIALANLLDEPSISSLKTLILQEHPEVLSLMASFSEGLVDTQSFLFRLKSLFQKLNERPKSPYPERTQEIMQFIKRRMKVELLITDEELDMIQSIIMEQKNEMIQSSFEVYQSNKDEEDFFDTIKRILVKIRAGKTTEIEKNVFTKKKENIPKENIDNKGSYFVASQKTQERSQELTKKAGRSQENPERQAPKVDNYVNIPEFQDKISKTITPVPLKKSDIPSYKISAAAGPQERSTKPATAAPQERAKAKNNMLDMIFKTFFEETEEDFEPIEIGFAKSLYEESNPDLINVLNTCETIPKAVVLIRDLAINAYMKFFKDNFEEKQMEYILKNKNERNSEICSIIHNFKAEGRVDHLKKVLQAVVLSKERLSQTISQQASTTGGNKYSKVAISRSKNKKTSFRMILHRETVGFQQQTVNIKTEDNDLPVIVTMGQEENPELREMLNKFYEEDITFKFTNNKNEVLFEEVLAATNDFINEEQKNLLRKLIIEQNYELLTILSKFERLNKNPKKIKTDLLTLLKKDSEGEELSGSPIIKKKKMKYNGFKQIISEIFERYRLISQKQVKLFQYLYMEEDLAVLGAYEVFLVTNELQDFIENLVVIDKYHYFKTRLDFDEIEQFDKSVEKQLEILFMYKKYLTNEQRNNLEKIIRAGDDHLLNMYTDFKKTNKKNEDFLKCLVELAEKKTLELHELEQKIKENRKVDTTEKKRLDTIDTFYQSKFLKKISYINLINELVETNHKMVDALFSIYEMNKDKADFVENLTLLHNWAYKENFRKLINKLKDPMNLKNNQIHFLMDCIEFDLPNIMAPYEIYMLNSEDPKSEEEFRETLRIILKVYVKEIHILEKQYY